MSLAVHGTAFIILGLIGLLSFSFTYSYAQTIQDLSCSACITISDTKTLAIHKELRFPIILWAENFDYSYDHNSIITINGHSKLNNPETPITITVSDPIGNIVTVDQVMVKPDSDFQLKFNTHGPLWKKDGMYIIKAQGGPTSTIFKTSVEVILCKPNEITLSADDHERYCLPYSTSGAIKSIEGFLSTNSKSIKLDVNSLDMQTIFVDIDRKLLDSKSSKGDEAFTVLVNDESSNFEEQESNLPNSRMLSIPIQPGGGTIEIIGTHAIPEFGSIAVIILVVTIITVIVISSPKLKLFGQFQKF